MTDQTFTMTAAHLARTLEQARARERQRIARYLDGQADAALGAGDDHAVGWLRDAAETLRSNAPLGAQSTAALPTSGKAATPATPVADPVETLFRDGVPPVAAAVDVGDGLAPVRFLDDETEGAAIVANLAKRGRLNFEHLPRD